VGDSHAAKFLWWYYEHPEGNEYVLHGLGGISAYSFASNDTVIARDAREVFSQIHTTDKELILMVLGDGDCRVHLYEHHRRDNVSLESLINDTIRRYGAFISTVDKPIAILDVPPAQRIEEQYDFEYYGSRDERAQIAVMFNSALKKWCNEHGILFIELHPHISDSRGWLKDEYAHPDGAHILHSAVQFVDEVISDYALRIGGNDE
jgi:hypothetical protein